MMQMAPINMRLTSARGQTHLVHDSRKYEAPEAEMVHKLHEKY